MQMAQGDFYCRQATEADLPEIAAIYALCVRNGGHVRRQGAEG
jgi:L-amino acid N-acyltransferase YncA